MSSRRLLLATGWCAVPFVAAVSAIAHGEVSPHEFEDVAKKMGEAQKVQSLALLPGGRLESLQPAAPGNGFDTNESRLENLVRREPVPLAHPVAGHGTPEGRGVLARGTRLSTDPVDLAASSSKTFAGIDPDEEAEIEDYAEACRQERARLSARLAAAAAASSSLLKDANISAETQAAEDDPCKLLNDRIAKAMPGHVVVEAPAIVDANGKKIEVPVATTASPEEETHSKAKKIAVVCSLMVAVAFVTVCCVGGFYFRSLNKKNAAAKEGLVGGRAGSRYADKRKNRGQTSGQEEAAIEQAPSVKSDPDPDF